MAQAGYCSVCGETVWLAPDGSCMKGHPPEFISGVYDVAESTEQAEPAYPDEVPISDPLHPVNQPEQAGYVPQVVPSAEPDWVAQASAPAHPQRVTVVSTPAEKPRRSGGLVALIIVAVVVLLCACIAIAGFFLIPALNSARNGAMPGVPTGIGGVGDAAQAQACIANQLALDAAAQAWSASSPGNELDSIDSLDAARGALGSFVTDFDAVSTCPAGGEISVIDGDFSCSIPEHSR